MRTNEQRQVISRTRYEPYGATAGGATPTIGFTGHVNDADTGLTYMQQRYYDPVAGRFMSVDPVLTDANTGSAFNRYVYANNSPYKYVDPDGRAPKRQSPMQRVIDSMNKAMLKGALARLAVKQAAEKAVKQEAAAATNNAARREAMRQEKIPTSQQPASQSTKSSGKEYSYEVPKSGGGTEIKSVQQQTMDRSHEGQPHWEAGKVKTDPLTGEVRMTDHGRPKLENDKSKVNVVEPQTKEVIVQKNLDAYLLELEGLTTRQPMLSDLKSLEFTEMERERAGALSLKPRSRFTVDFNGKCSPRFVSYVNSLYDKNPASLYIWTKKSNYCGIFEIKSILEFNFCFEFNVNQEGIVVLVATNMADKLVLDFSYENDPLRHQLEIESMGDSWPFVVY